jgi:hypothetical protein
MMDMMWSMGGGMGLIGVLLFILIILLTAALVKYLFFR